MASNELATESVASPEQDVSTEQKGVSSNSSPESTVSSGLTTSSQPSEKKPEIVGSHQSNDE